jgi:peptidyl-prolyl cis-trans isomerase SurA
LGIHQYYEEYKNNWLSRRGIEAKIYTLKSPGGEQLLASAFKKYSKKSDLDSRLRKKFNKKNDSLLIIIEGKWFKGDDPEIDKTEWISGSHAFNRAGYPSIILIKKIMEPMPLKFDDVKGEVMNGYQEFLESEWIRQLNKKYSVKIDNLVFDEVKKKLKNE